MIPRIPVYFCIQPYSGLEAFGQTAALTAIQLAYMALPLWPFGTRLVCQSAHISPFLAEWSTFNQMLSEQELAIDLL